MRKRRLTFGGALSLALLGVAPLAGQDATPPPMCGWLYPVVALDIAEIHRHVVTLLEVPDKAARAAAARALGRASSLLVPPQEGTAPVKHARHALTIVLHDPAPGVRLAAACALGRHGDADALVVLEGRRRSAPPELGEAIDWALAAIRARSGAPLLVRGATVVDGTGAAPRPNTSVLVEGGLITRVGPDGSFPVPRDARMLDATGRWLTPGLWDMHVHLGNAGASALPLFVGSGVTSVRDMGSDPAWVLGLRREVESGARVGPHIVTPGPMLEAPATLERMAAQQTLEPWRRTRVAVPGPEAAAAIVDSVASLGIDFIKIRESADLDTYRSVVAAARARGLLVAGHAPFGMDPREGARLGLATFEHASYPYPLDTVPRARAEVLRGVREGGTAIVPTMVAWATYLMHPDSVRTLMADTEGARDPRRPLLAAELVEEWSYDLVDREPMAAARLRGWCGFVNRTLEDLAALRDAGVPVLPGTDLGGIGLFPGWSLHDELEILVEGRVVTPAEALRAATAEAARHAGRGREVGTVAPGMRADLLLLRADPTTDVGALREIESVVLEG
ncbi:MAG TPA: amidohydrolase family protein, partial [Longimicrobiales bacterium]|nr:amidohydrolase family protein [Longimicrobiales bacterium]